MAPHYSEEGLVDGWEGLIEDITDQRTLSINLRKMTNMLQVLITNLPTGVYFVQAPQGYPILVNSRARRPSCSAKRRGPVGRGRSTLSYSIYRLHRPDGTEYPCGESCRSRKALRAGGDLPEPMTSWCISSGQPAQGCRSSPGRRPMGDLAQHGRGPMPPSGCSKTGPRCSRRRTAMRESELRLQRAVIETMAEGVIVQDDVGSIIDCNPAAVARFSACARG